MIYRKKVNKGHLGHLLMARVPQSKAKGYGNVIHPSIIDNIDDATPVITIIPPPELHLLLGPVNHIYDEMIKYGKIAIFGRNLALSRRVNTMELLKKNRFSQRDVPTRASKVCPHLFIF